MEGEEVKKLFSGVRKADAIKTTLEAVTGIAIIWTLDSVFNTGLPRYAYYTNNFFLIMSIALFGGLVVGFFQRIEFSLDPNLVLHIWGSYEEVRGKALNNTAKEVFIDKIRDVPLTLEQAGQMYRLASKPLDEEERTYPLSR